MPDRQYLAELYLPGLGAPDLGESSLAATLHRLEAAARASGAAAPVALVRTIAVPADDVAFCLVTGPSAAAVEELCRSAGCPSTRVAEAIESPLPSRPEETP